jgi:hypothetical protein
MQAFCKGEGAMNLGSNRYLSAMLIGLLVVGATLLLLLAPPSPLSIMGTQRDIIAVCNRLALHNAASDSMLHELFVRTAQIESMIGSGSKQQQLQSAIILARDSTLTLLLAEIKKQERSQTQINRWLGAHPR